MHLSLLLCCIFSVEIFIYREIKNKLALSKSIIIKVLKVLISKNISDHWKEKVIPQYALFILKNSFNILITLISIVLVFSVPFYLETTFFNYFVSLLGIIESLVICYLYLIIRRYLFE